MSKVLPREFADARLDRPASVFTPEIRAAMAAVRAGTARCRLCGDAAVSVNGNGSPRCRSCTEWRPTRQDGFRARKVRDIREGRR
jgi:hypothetical protein